MKKFSIIMLVLALGLLPCASWAESLTLEECISRALNINPELQQAKAKMETAEAEKGVAGVARRFKLDGTANIDVSNGIDADLFTKQSSFVLGTSKIGLAVEQLIFDGGKSHLQLSVAARKALAAQKDYEEAKNQLIAKVRDAYYNLNKATREKDVAKTRYDNQNDRLDLAKNFFKVGSKAKIDVTKAEADVAKAKLGLVSATTNERKNQATLAAAIGDPLLDVTAATDALEFENWKIDMESAVSTAIENRQEIKAQELNLASAEANLQLKRKGQMPELFLTGGLDSGSGLFVNDSYIDLHGGDAWRLGAKLKIPFLDGAKTLNESRIAKAQLEAAKFGLAKAKNDVALEVRTAWVALEQSGEAVTASREQERFAKDSLDLSKIRYKAGACDYLELSDAIDGYAEAQTNVINSLYDSKYAAVTLRKAMGEYK